MSRNKVYAIVEGHGEADPPDRGQPPAVVTLIARLLNEFQGYALYPATYPWRMRSGGDFTARDTLERALRAHKRFADCAAVLVLFDLDDGCPAQAAPSIARRIAEMEPLPFSVVVVCAHREYEAWFLASLETIHPGRSYAGDSESIRGAKDWLEHEVGYREVRDQARYTRAVDIRLASARSRSFRRLCHAFEELIVATQADQPIVTPS